MSDVRYVVSLIKSSGAVCLGIEFGNLQEAFIPIYEVVNHGSGVEGKGVFSMFKDDLNFIGKMFETSTPVKVRLLGRNVEEGAYVELAIGQPLEGNLTMTSLSSLTEIDDSSLKYVFFPHALISYKENVEFHLTHSHGAGTKLASLQLSIAVVNLSHETLKIGVTGRILPDFDEHDPIEELDLLDRPVYIEQEPESVISSQPTSIESIESLTTSEESDSLDLDGILKPPEDINRRLMSADFVKGLVWNRSSLIFKRGSKVAKESWVSVVTQNNVTVDRRYSTEKPTTRSRHLLLNGVSQKAGRGYPPGRVALMSVPKLMEKYYGPAATTTTKPKNGHHPERATTKRDKVDMTRIKAPPLAASNKREGGNRVPRDSSTKAASKYKPAAAVIGNSSPHNTTTVPNPISASTTIPAAVLTLSTNEGQSHVNSDIPAAAVPSSASTWARRQGSGGSSNSTKYGTAIGRQRTAEPLKNRPSSSSPSSPSGSVYLPRPSSVRVLLTNEEYQRIDRMRSTTSPSTNYATDTSSVSHEEGGCGDGGDDAAAALQFHMKGEGGGGTEEAGRSTATNTISTVDTATAAVDTAAAANMSAAERSQQTKCHEGTTTISSAASSRHSGGGNRGSRYGASVLPVDDNGDDDEDGEEVNEGKGEGGVGAFPAVSVSDALRVARNRISELVNAGQEAVDIAYSYSVVAARDQHASLYLGQQRHAPPISTSSTTSNRRRPATIADAADVLVWNNSMYTPPPIMISSEIRRGFVEQPTSTLEQPSSRSTLEQPAATATGVERYQHPLRSDNYDYYDSSPPADTSHEGGTQHQLFYHTDSDMTSPHDGRPLVIWRDAQGTIGYCGTATTPGEYYVTANRGYSGTAHSGYYGTANSGYSGTANRDGATTAKGRSVDVGSRAALQRGKGTTGRANTVEGGTRSTNVKAGEGRTGVVESYPRGARIATVLSPSTTTSTRGPATLLSPAKEKQQLNSPVQMNVRSPQQASSLSRTPENNTNRTKMSEPRTKKATTGSTSTKPRIIPDTVSEVVPQIPTRPLRTGYTRP